MKKIKTIQFYILFIMCIITILLYMLQLRNNYTVISIHYCGLIVE